MTPESTPGAAVVLLDGPVRSDGRVLRTLACLARLGPVVLYYPDPRDGDRDVVPPEVELRPVPRPPLPHGILRRSLRLHREHDFLADAAPADGARAALVWANDYPTLRPARRIAAAAGAPLVYDAHELWLETANQFFPADAPAAKRLVFRALTALIRGIGRRVERRLLADVDLLVTVNESCAAWFRERYGREDAFVVRNLPGRDAAREREAPPGAGAERTVLYQGVLNPGRGLEALVAAAARFAPGVRLEIVGDGMLADRLRDLAGERVSFAGHVPHDRLLDRTARADLGVLLVTPLNESKRRSLANKLFEYMASGVPVLATDLPEHRRVLDDTGAGWLLADTDPSAEIVAKTVNRVFADPAEMARRGAAGRAAFLDRYHWEPEEEKLRRRLVELARHPSPRLR